MAEKAKENKNGNEEEAIDRTLRPRKISDYIGQNQIKKNLRIFLEAGQKRKESLEHILLYGPAGLGKTTLAHIIAGETGVNIKTTSGPALERAGDLAAILTNLEDGDILFIDEIHRLPKTVEEVLYPAMEDFLFDIVIGKGPSARTVQLQLPQFTLIGATTRVGLLSAPFRSRFGVNYHLEFYDEGEIEQILERSASILGVKIEKSALKTVARRARQTPRVANRLLKRVRDYCQVKGDGSVGEKMAEEALEMLNVDKLGLERMDRRILETIVKKFNGGPVGLQALAASVGEEQDTIADVYEPYLLQVGLIERTSKGRMATKMVYDHLSFLGSKNEESGKLL